MYLLKRGLEKGVEERGWVGVCMGLGGVGGLAFPDSLLIRPEENSMLAIYKTLWCGVPLLSHSVGWLSPLPPPAEHETDRRRDGKTERAREGRREGGREGAREKESTVEQRRKQQRKGNKGRNCDEEI